MNHRTDRTIAGIVGLAEGLSTKLPNARQALLEQRQRIDGHPARGERVGPRGNAELTAVEAAASQRQHVEAQLKNLADELDAVVLTLRNLHRECDRHIGTRPEEVGRCSSTGREGALEWHDADCWDAPIRGPLCARHYQKERRWRIAHGLPTRDIEAA